MRNLKTNKTRIILLAVLVFAIIILSIIFNQASTRRWFRDIQSEFSNGIDRTINVYDMNGDIIKTYDGKFDVEIENQKIKFDDANGKRHIIVVGSGTVCIDDK